MQVANDAQKFGNETAEFVLAALTDVTLDPDRVTRVADQAARTLALGAAGVAIEYGQAVADQWRDAAQRGFNHRIASARRSFQLEPGGVAA